MTPRSIMATAVVAAVLLTGCDSDKPSGKTPQTKSSKAPAPASPSTTSGDTPPDTPPPPPPGKPHNNAPVGDCGEDCPAAATIDLFEGIGPAKVGMSSADVMTALGTPDSTTKQGAVTTYAYGSAAAPALRIQVRGGNVVSVWTTNPGDATKDNIKVGSTKKAVLAVYPASCSVVGENLACRWNQEESARWMEFTVDAVTGKVIGIGVGEGDGT